MLRRIARSLRPALVLLAVFLVVGLAGVAYQGVRTLQRLTVVEADRDRWQQPTDIIWPLISRKDTFIHPPGDEVWWLITASQP